MTIGALFCSLSSQRIAEPIRAARRSGLLRRTGYPVGRGNGDGGDGWPVGAGMALWY
jgi:hypothetical protein